MDSVHAFAPCLCLALSEAIAAGELILAIQPAGISLTSPVPLQSISIHHPPLELPRCRLRMSLYYDASSIIEDRHSKNDSLKLTVFAAAKKLRSPAGQLFALLSGTLSWNDVLVEVIERAEIIEHERKLTPELSLLLVHDLLFAKKGISAPANHPLRASVERHRNRLQAELTKLRVERGCTSIESLKITLSKENNGDAGSNGLPLGRPRWIRINTLKTTSDDQLKTTFRDFKLVDSLEPILKAHLQDEASTLLYVDAHIPDLIAVPMSIDISGWKEYHDGNLILQDKASCFPAYLLDPGQDDYVIDACAAPGNKTTHVAALLGLQLAQQEQRIWACERDRSRAELLQRMVRTAGADRLVLVRAKQDFLKLQGTATQITEAPWAQTTALLLDPSCSGSGMIGRDEAVDWKLPARKKDSTGKQGSKKRKISQTDREPRNEENEVVVSTGDPAFQERLRSLAAFQLKLLLHAFSFPMARKITYSTCSVHNEENELVVLAALASSIAKEHGWSILPRANQVEGMKKWYTRGNSVAFEGIRNTEEVTDACIRCFKGTMDGTQGFFVAAFRRSPKNTDQASSQSVNVSGAGSQLYTEEEWAGFSDSSE